MRVLKGLGALERELPRPVILTVGNFDGVHLGHRQILENVVNRARAVSGTSVVYTFRPHPQIALRPERPLDLLTTYDERIDAIGLLEPQVLIEEPFSREFSNISPDDFFSNWLRKRLAPSEIVVGYDFGFGKSRSGSLELLRNFCTEAAIKLEVVPAFEVEGKAISSSRIRACLMAKDLAGAQRLLGRYFSYTGVVTKGDGRGSQIGFPTANLHFEDKLALPNGVYATWVWLQGKRHASVTNLGVRPTFQSSTVLRPQIETHILEWSGDLYGQKIKLEMVEHLRPEQRFASVDALVSQIRQDVDIAKQRLSTLP